MCPLFPIASQGIGFMYLDMSDDFQEETEEEKQ